MTKKELWEAIGELSCVVTGSRSISIHHCQGGSMSVALTARGLDGTKGAGLRGYSDFLVIPLHPQLHHAGPEAIDGCIGRHTWELKYGHQCDHLNAVGQLLGVDLWYLHALNTGQLQSYQPKTPFSR